uniref:Glucosidase 2 subunit beta n=1 Tax=Oryzias sinensis TaxID=183150 RepID=A0A8C7XSF3_9TELE
MAVPCLLLVLLLLCGAASPVEVQRPRGVPLSKRQFYEEDKPFTCLDGSLTVPFDRVNDDYCDCKDGSDEPGTAACPNGSFHCTNAGFRPAFIPSSRINDGICGMVIVITVNNRIFPSFLSHSVTVNELLPHSELDPDADGTFTETEAQGLLGGVDKVDAASFESVWNNIKEKFHSESHTDTPAPEETYQEETKEPASDNDSELYPDDDIPEDDDDEEDPEDEDLDEGDYKGSDTLQTHDKKEEEEGTMPPYDQETQSLIDAAQKARDEFNEAEKALRDVDDQIRNLEKEISFDFGASAEFAYLYSQCYELHTGEYIYKLCPFNRVSQKPKYGGSETNLGTWGKWAGPEDNVYSVMKYEHGTGCWQGPNRSTTVKLTCGKETVVTSTSEPSRCEYLMEFTTPAVCQEPQNVGTTFQGHEEL